MKNQSRKKVVKMTDDERDEMKKTTADIRRFFEEKTVPHRPEVSPIIFKSNLDVLSNMVKCRLPPDASIPGRRTTGGEVRLSPDVKYERRGGREDTGTGIVAGMPRRERRDQLQETPSMFADTLCGERRDRYCETKTLNNENVAVCADARKDARSIVRKTVCRDAVSDERGCNGLSQLCNACNESCKPGTHQDDRKGDKVCNVRVYGSGNGNEGCSNITSLKTKPSEVSGGLKAKISLWEMKIGGTLNEKLERKHMESTADRGSSRSGGTDRK